MNRCPGFKIFFLAVFLIGSSLAGFASAQTQTLDNSGFVPGNLWFSNIPGKPGETVKIYTLVWNGSKSDITGTVSFFDNGEVIDKQSFVLAGDGGSKMLSAPWTAGAGYHKVYAEITESSGAPRGSKAITLSLQYPKTDEAEQFIGGPKVEGGATTTAKNFVEEKIDYAKGYAEANLPKPVVGTAKYAVENIENTRGEVKGWSEKKAAALKSELASTATSGGGKWFGAEKPFKYAAMFLASLLAFIVGNDWVFYSLLVIAVFFALRFVRNKFFF